MNAFRFVFALIVAMPSTSLNAQIVPPVKAPMTEAAVTELCTAQSAKPVPTAIAQRVVGAVNDEWRRFGAFQRDGSKPALVDGEVRLPRLESGWDELQGASTFESWPNAFVWARVDNYWAATGNHSILGLAYGIQTDANGDPVRVGGEIQRRTVPLDQTSTRLKALRANGWDANTLKALEVASIRASLIEQPWSAVFVSSMMRVAELTPTEFQPASSHSTYMRKALSATYGQTPAEYRYIACPPAPSVTVRPGDLICNGRLGVKGGFGTLVNNTSFTSHCDVVVSATQKNGKFEILSIGGNVGDTVARTRYTGTGAPSLARIENSEKSWIAVLLLR
jgi:Uncharacterized protein conserved in bacteria (DUF2272)